MNFRFLSLFVLICMSTNAQVPVKSSGYGEAMDVAVEVPDDSESTGYYQQNGKYGFVVKRVRQQAIYDRITHSSQGYIVKKDGKFGITDKQGNLIGAIAYDSIGSAPYQSGNAYQYMRKGQSGSMDYDGKPILSPKYHKILFSDHRNPFSVVQNKKGEITLIRNKRESEVREKFSAITLYANIAVAKTGGKFGAITENGTVIPFVYDSIFYTYTKMQGKQPARTKPQPIDFRPAISQQSVANFIVKKGGKVGLVSSSGDVIYEPNCDAIYFSGNTSGSTHYLIEQNKLLGAYLPSNKKKIDVQHSRLSPDGNRWFYASIGSKTGIYNFKGDLIVPVEYQEVMAHSRGFVVRENGKEGMLDMTGKTVVPMEYDDVDSFYSSGFDDFVKVKNGELYGIAHLSNVLVVPVAYQHVDVEGDYFQVVTPNPDRKFGLFDRTGRIVVPAEYRYITRTATEASMVRILKKSDSQYVMTDMQYKPLFPDKIVHYRYVLDENKLLNPLSPTRQYLISLRNDTGKSGLLNERTAKLDVPMVYDSIYQRFNSRSHTYFKVRTGKKFGLIDEVNNIVIPFEYDAMSIDKIAENDESGEDIDYLVVVAKGNKFGAVNLKNEIRIPFVYSDLQRVSDAELFPARKGKHYILIDGKNKTLNAGPFDHIGYFEDSEENRYSENRSLRALTFYGGKMRPINEKGVFLDSPVAMQPHLGYETFDELKFALVKAMDSPNDELLRDVANRIAPSEHLLFFLKHNVLNEEPLYHVDIAETIEKYFQILKKFKVQEWRRDDRHYNPRSLTQITDYTLFRDGAVSVRRTEDHAYGDTRIMEKVLRNAIKVNGYWISTFFMRRNF